MRTIAPTFTRENPRCIEGAFSGSEFTLWVIRQKWSDPLEKLLALMMADRMSGSGVCSSGTAELAWATCSTAGAVENVLCRWVELGILQHSYSMDANKSGFSFGVPVDQRISEDLAAKAARVRTRRQPR